MNLILILTTITIISDIRVLFAVCHLNKYVSYDIRL